MHVALVGDEVRGREPERPPAPVAGDDLALEHERRARGSAGRSRRRRRRRAPGSGSRRRSRDADLDERHDRRLELVAGGEHLGRALRLGAEAEVLADADVPGRRVARSGSARRTPPAAIVENSRSNGITTSSVDAEALDHVALDRERHDQLRRRLGVDDRERVRLEREHGVGPVDHLAVADVDAVEAADRDRRGRAGSASGSCVTLMLHRAWPLLNHGKHDLGSQQPVLRARDRDQPPVAEQPDRPRRRGACRRAPGSGCRCGPAGRRRGRARSPADGRRARRAGRIALVLVVGRQRELADRGPPQRLAVGVAERLDQRPDVGAGRALDLEGRPPLPAPDQFGPVDLDLAGRAARPPRRGAPSCRGARRRPGPPRSSGPSGSIRPVGSSRRSGTRPVSVSSPSGSPVVERQPSRAVATYVFGSAEDVALQARRGAEQDDQQPGRERVERAGVAGLRRRARGGSGRRRRAR